MWYIAQSNVAIDDRSLRLQWDPVQITDLAGYHVYMSVGDNLHFKRLTPVPITTTTFVGPVLRRDVQYFIYVTTIDDSGNESEPSSVMEFQLRDAILDLNWVDIPPPRHEVSLVERVFSKPVYTPQFMTKFEWRDPVWANRRSIVLPSGAMGNEPIPTKNFNTLFQMGG